MKKITCAEARYIDLVDYLASLGYYPKKSSNNNYWYLSPFRQERTASFKVYRNRNIWYDHGSGRGGDIIDFGVLYHNCSMSDFLVRLSDTNTKQLLSFHQLSSSGPPISNAAGEKECDTENKIVVSTVRPLSSPELLHYLEIRFIPTEIASRFCSEVEFTLYKKKQIAIGFQNDCGGYELRNRNFKGSSSPKAPAFIDNKSTSILVFEGFFDFLSYQSLPVSKKQLPANFLVLNSLAFFEKQRIKMEEHQQIRLFLDRDPAGMKCTERALKASAKYIDESHLYNNHKDLNERLIQTSRSRILLEKMNKKMNNRLVNKQIKSNRHGRI